MTMTISGAPQGLVVCGIDGSAGSRRALVEAVRAAARRGDRVHALWAYEPPNPVVPWTYGPPIAASVPTREVRAERATRAARSMVDRVLAELRPELGVVPEVTVEAVPGDATELLVGMSRSARELYVGSRGRGLLPAAVLGSTGLRCVTRAACPVTVVPGPERARAHTAA
jgi:nucleotide-binding universal stress UspA family protein